MFKSRYETQQKKFNIKLGTYILFFLNFIFVGLVSSKTTLSLVGLLKVPLQLFMFVNP
jgi:hypothetical protein